MAVVAAAGVRVAAIACSPCPSPTSTPGWSGPTAWRRPSPPPPRATTARRASPTSTSPRRAPTAGRRSRSRDPSAAPAHPSTTSASSRRGSAAATPRARSDWGCTTWRSARPDRRTPAGPRRSTRRSAPVSSPRAPSSTPWRASRSRARRRAAASPPPPPSTATAAGCWKAARPGRPGCRCSPMPSSPPGWTVPMPARRWRASWSTSLCAGSAATPPSTPSGCARPRAAPCSSTASGSARTRSSTSASPPSRTPVARRCRRGSS